MVTHHGQITDANGNGIANSQALWWGNNAAWICACGRLLGNRTADGENEVECPQCHTEYEIQRAPNKNGSLNLGAATGVMVV